MGASECRMKRFPENSPILYQGIDYHVLAERLYDATWGRWGTDEEEVFKVYKEAVGLPLSRAMSQFVTVNEDGKSKSLKYVQARMSCSLTDMGYRAPANKESPITDVAIDKLSKEFVDVLRQRKGEEGVEKAKKETRKANNGFGDYPREILNFMLNDEIGADEALLLDNYGFEWPKGTTTDRIFDLLGINGTPQTWLGYGENGFPWSQPTTSYATSKDCKAWLVSSKYLIDTIDKPDDETSDAVCAFLKK